MATPNELLALMALTSTPQVGVMIGRKLIDYLGSAAAVYEHRTEIPQLIPEARPALVQLLDCSQAWQRAQEEMAFVQKHNIRCLAITDADYPARLRECDDAPLLLYWCGNANLNAAHVVSMVGTRKCTDYGRDLCATFIRDLQQLCDDVIIVSGLAYGIDVASHRAALSEHVPTVGVVAHGLDRVYPAAHRQVAVQMVKNGGMLTEYKSHTTPEKQNFVARNRIVAGMADAVVVVESAARGGSLITAGLAGDYNRECVTFPGRTTDAASAGCHNLVMQHKASLITNAEDFMAVMNWSTKSSKPQQVQRELFVNLNVDEQRIMNMLRQQSDGMQINLLALDMDIPMNRLQAMLFGLEMKGVIRSAPGGVYRAIG